MLNIEDNADTKEPVPILRLGFRPLFLAGASFSVFALLIWAGVLSQSWEFNPYGGSYWWHAHEMLFGFVSTIIAGFLLTAVQSWTGVPGVKGYRLLFLVMLWLSGRVVILFNVNLPSWCIATIDVMFLLTTAFFLALSIIKVRQYRNLFFVPVLLLMSLSNVYMHMAIYLSDAQWLVIGSHGMVMLVMALMCVLGGRVFPMFTANGTKTSKVEPWPWLEKLSLLLVAVLVIVFMFVIPLSKTAIAVLFSLAAFAHLLRWLRWRFWVTFKTPLVWSLHSSYFCIPLGMGLFAFHFFGFSISFSLPMHVITVGAVGGMILSMISRVSLGHTGRPIISDLMHTAAFVFILLSLLFRVSGSLLSDMQTALLIASVICWCGAYGIFVVKYIPILTKPRVGGGPG